MRTWPRTVAVAMLLLCAPAARAGGDPPAEPAPAPGQHCLGDPQAKWLARVDLAGALNPRGLETYARLGRCLPLVTRPGPWWDYTNLQYGLTGTVSPAYAMPGAFLSVRPLSILELRADAELVQQWRTGLDGAGYFPLTGYGADWSTLPASRARPAQGYTTGLTAWLVGGFPLGGGWSLLTQLVLSWKRWDLGGAPYYYNVQNDLPMARREWLSRDIFTLVLDRQLTERAVLRGGLVADETRVEGSGYRQVVVSGLLTTTISGWPGPKGETLVFLRLGAYTAHAYHQGEAQLIAGVSTTFDLSPGAAR
jgi:hypothetical protein